MSSYDFYTPITLTKSLLSLLPSVRIQSIIDICCGQGNMLAVAGEKYPEAIVEGVDIEHTPSPGNVAHATFYKSDGRDYAIQCFHQEKTFDLILLNPPFGYLSKADQKLEYSALNARIYKGLLNSRYEYEMLQAALLLAHDTSYVLLILPSTFIVGETLLKARREIAQDYSICAIIELPKETFYPIQVNTVAVILKKGSFGGAATELYRITNTDCWPLDRIGEVSFSSVCAGNWRMQNLKDSQEALNSFEIHRGFLSSNQFTQEGSPILHCSAKKNSLWSPSIRYYDPNKISRKMVFANRNDVIINRIGKAAGFWYINPNEAIPISDCLYVLRKPSAETIQRLTVASDLAGRLKIPIRGLSTQYIVLKDIRLVLKGDSNHG